MADIDSDEILTEYATNTKGLMGYLTNAVGNANAWTNVAGVMSKIATSSAGWVWGYNKTNQVFVCKEPCTGGWTQVDTTVLGSAIFQDISVDASTVYVAYTAGSGTFWATKPIANSAEWTVYTSPQQFTSIVPTNNFLWANSQTQGLPLKCAKPCTTNGWANDTELAGVNVLGSDGASIYGSPDGAPGLWKRDEQGQQSWAPLQYVTTPVTAVAAESSNTDIYTVDALGNLQKCSGSTCNPVDTLGYKASTIKGSITKNPEAQKVWLLSSANDLKGNIFEKTEGSDFTPILKQVNASEAIRDGLVGKLAGGIRQQTNAIESEKVTQEAVAAVKSIGDVATKLGGSADTTQTLKTQIASAQGKTASYVTQLVPLQILTATLLVCVVLYGTLGMILPTIVTNMLVILIGSVGLGAAIYFSVKSNAGAQRFIQSIFPTPPS